MSQPVNHSAPLRSTQNFKAFVANRSGQIGEISVYTRMRREAQLPIWNLGRNFVIWSLVTNQTSPRLNNLLSTPRRLLVLGPGAEIVQSAACFLSIIEVDQLCSWRTQTFLRMIKENFYRLLVYRAPAKLGENEAYFISKRVGVHTWTTTKTVEPMSIEFSIFI